MEMKSTRDYHQDTHSKTTAENASKIKLEYVPPAIDVDIIQMEGGIAATSGARIQIGSEGNNFTPEVEDWRVTESEQQIFL
ncbi:hypothetical protein DI53_3173 [Sphingobacterium deserti]|uniref:Uncharacterized protein n=2 Tax=Sphingobacterium deserti TaxID=1229276 RepID=A0A0B8SZI2_9SPHI|nr:hypothetical protein DI53_3173 [Sphingobacterium deserti]